MYNRLHSNVDECEQRNFFKLDSRLLEFLNQFVTEEKWGEMSMEESIACSKGITLKISTSTVTVYSTVLVAIMRNSQAGPQQQVAACGSCEWQHHGTAVWLVITSLALSERRASSTYKEATEWNITSMASTVPVEKIVQ